MTWLGWLFMILSVGGVWALMIWCFTRVLSYEEPPPEPVKDFHSA